MVVAWLGILILGWLAVGEFYPANRLFIFKEFRGYWNPLANFDGFHYFKIIQGGYNFGLSQSFFPGFPLIGRLIYWLVGPSWTILVSSGLNLLLLFLSLYLLIKVKGVKNFSWFLPLLLLWPSSFYLVTFYSESLFFFLSLLAFYFYSRYRIRETLILAGLASGVRLVGIFIVLGFIGERLLKLLALGDVKEIFKIKVILKTSAWLLIGGFGLWLFMGFLQFRFGDAFIFVHNQAKFLAGRETDRLVFLPQVFYRYFKMFLTTPPSNPIFFVLVLEVWTTLLAMIGLIIGMVKKLPSSWWIYGWASLILPTLTGTLSSMPRYTLVVFPAILGLSFLPQRLKLIIIGVNGIFLIFAWMRFLQGWWVA